MENYYGSIFKTIRKQKGFSLKELASDSISVSTLSRFESGKINISIDKFFTLLFKMNISPQEYFTYLEDAWGVAYSISMINVPMALDNNNYTEIESLIVKLEAQNKKIGGNKSFQLQIIGLKATLSKIDPSYKIREDEFKLIRQHLISSKIWGEFELQLCARSLFLFNTNDLRLIIQKLLDPFNYPLITFNIRLYTYTALVALADTLLQRKEYEFLKRIEQYTLTNPIPERYTFQKGSLRFKLALYHYHTGDKNEAMLELNTIISGFQALGAELFASRLKDEIKKLDL